MRILFLSRWFPFPTDNGSKIRIFNLLKYLSARHQVHLIAFSSEPVAAAHLEAMRRYCSQVEVIPYLPFRPRGLKALVGFLSPRPRSVLATYSADFKACVEQASRSHVFDLVIASQIDMALYPLLLPGVPRLLEELELTAVHDEYTSQSGRLKKLRGALTWWKLSRYVAELLPVYQGCTVVSQRERERVQEALPNYTHTVIVPNGIDSVAEGSDWGPPEPNTLIYAGALTFRPNFVAVEFFLREVFPLIRARCPTARLLVTGKLDGVPVDQLPATDGVCFTGYLEDVRPRIATSWLSIVPLQSGGGTRVKILESLALGTPVVATSKGAEGLDLAPGRDLLVANEPDNFAEAVLRVLGNADLRRTLSQNGRQAVDKQYAWPLVGRAFCDLVENTAGRAGSAA